MTRGQPFLWLDDQQRTGAELDEQQIQREFIKASIPETAGKPDDALVTFRTLQRELRRKHYKGRLADHVDVAIKRLSRSH